MKKNRIALLRERYISAKKNHKEPYFDAEEIDDLLNSFEEINDFSLYEEVLALGLRLHPEDTILQMCKCRQLIRDDKIDEALTLIRKIGEKGDWDLYLLEMECYVYLNDYTKVVELTENLLARKVDFMNLLFEHVTPLLNDMEMFDEAVDYAEKGLRLFPESLLLKEELYFSLENTEDFDRAITICNELIDQKPYSFDEWFALGRLYSYKSNFESAIEAFDFALTCDDSVIELKLLLAYCLSKNGNYKRALDVCREVLSDETYKERITMLMTECHIKMHDYDTAYKLLKELINESPHITSSSVYIQFIGCCMEMERLEEAYNALKKAYSLDPDNQEILFLLSFFPKNEKEKEIFLTKLYDAMEKISDDEKLLEMTDRESFLLKRTDQLNDPRILTKFLAKEYINNKENSN